jgi:putative glutamine amidotransferase
MKRQIIVGISQRIDIDTKYNESRDALDQRMIDLALHCEFMPVPIPNNLVEINLPSMHKQVSIMKWLNNTNINALILSGGNDIGTMPQRDLTEYHLLKWAKNNNIPVLGICRGMQMMADFFGVSLKQVSNHAGVRHKIITTSENFNLLPDEVNSYHDLVVKKCPDDFDVLAYSEDNEIEAIRHKYLPWEGWMWHPERDHIFEERNSNGIKRILKNE